MAYNSRQIIEGVPTRNAIYNQTRERRLLYAETYLNNLAINLDELKC